MARKLPSTAFKKGQSGNPGGRPKISSEVRKLAGKHTIDAIKKLVSIMNNKKVDHKTQIAAAKELLDRAIGRAPQSIALSGDPDNPIEHNWTVTFRSAKK